VAVSFIGGGNRSALRKPPTCRKSLTNFYTWCCAVGFELTTLVVMGNDCTCSCKSNYHMITTTTAPSWHNSILKTAIIYILFNYYFLLKNYEQTSGQNSDNTIWSLLWGHDVTSAQLSIVVWKMSASREKRFVGVSAADTLFRRIYEKSKHKKEDEFWYHYFQGVHTTKQDCRKQLRNRI